MSRTTNPRRDAAPPNSQPFDVHPGPVNPDALAGLELRLNIDAAVGGGALDRESLACAVASEELREVAVPGNSLIAVTSANDERGSIIAPAALIYRLATGDERWPVGYRVYAPVPSSPALSLAVPSPVAVEADGGRGSAWRE